MTAELRAVTDPDAELARLRRIAARAADLVDCIDQRRRAGWLKAPAREVEALRRALNGEPL